MDKHDFLMPSGHYFGSHSAGRPFADTMAQFQQDYFQPWGGDCCDPWGEWLGQIERFRAALAALFNVDASGFCPQSNVSSGLVKVAMALPQLQSGGTVLLSEHDFPSIGFALQQALPNGAAQLRFIPKGADLTDANVWDKHLTADVALVWITHGFSNLGAAAPLAQILPLARQRGILSAIDLAQSAGVLPLDLAALQPDFAFGSSLKWLCGGAGAGYLWASAPMLSQCQPKDVGWFSHQDPFEMNIHQFRYHDQALRFWGGTPTVAPFVFAAHSIERLSAFGIDNIRAHNLSLQQQLWQGLGERVLSPQDPGKRSGTIIINADLTKLKAAGVFADLRPLGVRVSPHIYNDSDDVAALINALG
ncbi:aminotransferase class V-fold PLP-dependent enzyme [uncultured Ferrimonas sp.]|uniref:aminotransferase class V-fold PLP-dependent enzyme n=1 Tax=uncultured Ferrimonas sp. TaxID=432640 RepID=UPI002609D0AD|nr:aminotransferase class V-fold PLP-dependent enzyme [uncultured Ferrimonas sp.]